MLTRVAAAGAQPALQLLAGVLLHRRDHVAPVVALLLDRVGRDRPGVVEAVRHVVPVALDHGIADLRAVVEHAGVQAHAAADVVLVGDLEHPPEALTRLP